MPVAKKKKRSRLLQKMIYNKKLNFLLTTLLTSAFCSCNANDEPSANSTEPVAERPPEPTLEELRDETTTTLTSGSTKTWRINHATLTHGNSEIDISQNFNVRDDEFIFGGTTVNGSLQWRRGYDIETNATSAQEAFLDNYVSPLTTAFSYQDNSSTVVEAPVCSCTFEIKDDTISATVINDDDTVFSFHLVEKTQADYASAPESGLHFTSAFTFESNSISGYAPGMIGSYANNSLFIATREDDLNHEIFGLPERILKFNSTTHTIAVESQSFEQDFVSKQLLVVDNQLIVIGGQIVKQCPLNFGGAPAITASHGKRLSRFGISVLDGNVYIIGGDVDNVESNQIFSWNIDSQTLDAFATLPEPKSGAGGTIVHDTMYVFGGTDTLFGDTPTNTIYKLSINNPSDIETFRMNKAINFTFVRQFQNLIYVAGQIHIKDESGTTVARESTIGVFNTLDHTYQELTTNLTNTSGFDTIHQMCIVNDKMYIIYGNQGTDTGGQFPEWDVLVSDLD